jgi:quercetin dioxygenase-like cupin family protein
MRTPTLILTSLLPVSLLLAAAPARAEAPPVERAPFHIPVFGNDEVALLDVPIPAGREAGWHRHSRDFVFVVVRDSDLLLQNWGESETTRTHWPRGMAAFGAFSKKPLVHRGQNVGPGPLHFVGFEFLRDAPLGRATSARPPAYREIIDNERLRGWRLTLKPGESAPAFAQTAPMARIVVEGGLLTEAWESGDQEMALAPGGFQWRAAGAAPALRNEGDSTIDLVEIETK